MEPMQRKASEMSEDHSSAFPLYNLMELKLILQHRLKTLSFYPVFFPLTRNVSLLKKDLEHSLKLPASCQDWYLRNESVMDTDTMNSLNVKPHDVIFVKRKNQQDG